jgi:hypothetical protein
MRSTLLALGALVAVGAAGVQAQDLPLAPLLGSGDGVTPAFEGWYDAGDGSYIIYFGYNNRNANQAVDVPLGENNFIEPAQYDGDQPTHFEPRRDWGVFGIRVPATMSPDAKIYWNIVVRGKTYRVPGHLKPDWKTDALGGNASDAMPPIMTAGGAEGAGPFGVTSPETLRTRVGQGLELSVGVTRRGAAGGGLLAAFGALSGGAPDAAAGGGAPADAQAAGDAPADAPAASQFGGADPDQLAAMMGAGGMRATWFKHQGPGSVTFSQNGERVPEDAPATTVATFDTPGDYVVRVRATEADMATEGHSQCCWSNAFLRVSVTP